MRAETRGKIVADKRIEDPFFKTFFTRIPKDVADSYSDAQLDAIKLAFGARTRGTHGVDVRLTIPLIARRFYVVFLAGAERRPAGRLALERALRPVWTIASAVFIGFFVLAFAGSLLAVLYTLKMALGIDVFPGVDMLPDDKIQRLLR